MTDMIEVPDDTEAFWALSADDLAKPLPPIPLHETPIYAQMIIEQLNRAEHFPILPRTFKPGGRITPILKNGRKP